MQESRFVYPYFSAHIPEHTWLLFLFWLILTFLNVRKVVKMKSSLSEVGTRVKQWKCWQALAGAEWIAVLQGWMLSCPPSPIHTIVLKEEETRQWHKRAHMLHTLQLTGISQDLVETQNLVKSCSDIFAFLTHLNLLYDFPKSQLVWGLSILNHIWSLRSASNDSGLW